MRRIYRAFVWWVRGSCSCHHQNLTLHTACHQCDRFMLHNGGTAVQVPFLPTTARDTFYWRYFHLNSNFTASSIDSHPNSDTEIATIFCTWHDSSAVVPCAKHCSDMITRNRVTRKQIFPQIWIRMKILEYNGPQQQYSSRVPHCFNSTTQGTSLSQHTLLQQPVADFHWFCGTSSSYWYCCGNTVQSKMATTAIAAATTDIVIRKLEGKISSTGMPNMGRNLWVVMMTMTTSLSLELVIMTTSHAKNDDKVSIMKTYDDLFFVATGGTGGCHNDNLQCYKVCVMTALSFQCESIIILVRMTMITEVCIMMRSTAFTWQIHGRGKLRDLFHSSSLLVQQDTEEPDI